MSWATVFSARVTQEVQPGTARIPVNVGSDWGTGAYVVATLRRPLDAKAERMPGRAIGVQWFSIDKKAHTLALDMKMPALLRPNSRLQRADQGRWSRLRQIRLTSPSPRSTSASSTSPTTSRRRPTTYYLGQRQLAAELRDLYGQLIDGMQGTRGADQDRRRRGRPAQRQSADAGAAGAVLGHRRGPQRPGRGGVRHSGLRRHRPRDGGGLEQGQGRPRQRRRHSARSGGADGDLAALHAHGRPELDEPRPRQRRGRGGRLSA